MFLGRELKNIGERRGLNPRIVESQSTALPLGYVRQKIYETFCGADSGNRTRTSCLEGKGTTTMQYPRSELILIENFGIVKLVVKILFFF